MSNYDRFPATKIKGYENTAVRGYDAIFDVLKEKMQGKKYWLWNLTLELVMI